MSKAMDGAVSSPYRKVSASIWADEKVRRLTPIQPSGQALFVMLLTGPQTTNIPGVQPVGRAAFAEMLDWEQEAFDEAFEEVFQEGLAVADWKARLVFVPKAIRHNAPQSPNVVKSWASTWARVPECDLKREAWRLIYQELLQVGQPFADAFKAACPLGFSDAEGSPASPAVASPKPTPKASRKPSAKTIANQEQEQEQEQEHGAPSPPSASLDHGLVAAASGADAPAPPAPPPSRPSKAERGTRLSEDWQLPKAWGEWAMAEFPQWTADKVRSEAAKFRDHWVAKAGRDATKLDWLATWRNWCRADIAHRDDHRPAGAGRGPPAARPGQTARHHNLDQLDHTEGVSPDGRIIL